MAIAAVGSPPAEGPIEYEVPQVADRAEPFASRVRAGLARRTAELERLAVEMFARGLSTRDIEAAFRDASGASVLSRTAVSQVTERLDRNTKPSPGGISVNSRSPTCSSTAMARRSCCTWRRARGGHGKLHGLLRGSQAPRVDRPAARRHRRGARADPWRRASRGRCASAALSTDCGIFGAKPPKAGGQRSRCGREAVTRRRRRPSPRCCAMTSSKRTSGSCRRWCSVSVTTSTPPAPASTLHSHHEPAGATLSRGVPTDEDHSERVRRAPGAEADVR